MEKPKAEDINAIMFITAAMLVVSMSGMAVIVYTGQSEQLLKVFLILVAASAFGLFWTYAVLSKAIKKEELVKE